jgi:hypothetical protein
LIGVRGKDGDEEPPRDGDAALREGGAVGVCQVATKPGRETPLDSNSCVHSAGPPSNPPNLWESQHSSF